MAQNNVAGLLTSVDDLFSTEDTRKENKLEKIINLNIAEINDFPNHPFKVRMDEAMQEMAESVRQYGILVPALVRPKPDGGYEMVAGHKMCIRDRAEPALYSRSSNEQWAQERPRFYNEMR